jgi:hypothetical protein
LLNATTGALSVFLIVAVVFFAFATVAGSFTRFGFGGF